MARAQAPAEGAVIRGRIVDLQTGEPIAKVSVSVAGSTAAAITDEDGRFLLQRVPAGALELRIFTVGYGLLKKQVSVAAGATVQLDLRLGQEALRLTQEVTVVAGPFDPVLQDAPTQYTLDNSELQALSTVLANDPMRAVANLPGVAANQDFYAAVAVRGAGPEHIGVYVDGVLIDHPAYSLEDSGDIGSLSVVNGDLVRSAALLSGAFPARYGDRTGAVLDFLARDGARDRIATRFTADVLGAELTSEGPLGGAKKASWLVSGRQSYLGYLLSRLGYSGSLTLNYDDVSARLSYDSNAHHRFSWFSSFGSTSAERSPITTANEQASSFTNGAAQHGMESVRWDWIPSANTLLQSQAFWTRDHEHDTNQYAAVDLDTTTNVYGFHEDLTQQVGRWNKFEAGVEARSPHEQRNSFTQWNYAKDTLSTSLLSFDNYARSAWLVGGYVQDTAMLLKDRVEVSLGGRWDSYTPSSQNVWLPHASVLLKAAGRTSVTLAYGQYAQMPALLQLYGAFGTTSLRAEHATHEMVGLDQFFSERTRLHVEFYNRQEHEDIYSQLTEFRLLANGQVGFPVLGPVEGNTLDAYARGFEISLQRRSANRLSGWISYAYSASKYWQPGMTFSFYGDYDQRNTFSAYGAYRITKTIELSGNTRYGSGLPITGFLGPSTTPASDTSVVFPLSTARNALRQPDYLRNDVRLGKVFTTKHLVATLHGEIENLTGHTNYRYYEYIYPGNVGMSHQVDVKRESTLPFLPAAGLTLEF